MYKEFCCIQNSSTETQKLIRTWMSSGYDIEIISQVPLHISPIIGIVIVTSLYRIKK